MTRTRTPSGENGSQTSLIHILLSIVDLMSAHHGHMRQELGEIKGLLTAPKAETESIIRRAFAVLGSILGHWGTISLVAAACWRFVRPWLLGW